ncbi:tetratricopeptide repeat protein [Xanthovirga aplysinae]|uniref:tetratricopeptide repeat protein n=1 Tax=Xanthovirga aplysinae TaxID=2529853 RepID=UPI0012BB8E80|nr:tetratricopeptide repeat protein [Xanthovirga aplysinae]MTI32117.1 tetratricopeptide repeat protein [Xanthovirga aplysinae]
MNSERTKQLLGFLKKDPDDPFIKYAIAMEYQKTDKKKALFYFESLLKEHEDYLPTYYHVAKLLIDINQKKEVEGIFKKGIELAQKQGDYLALRELQNAYTNYLFEEE